MRRVAHDRRKVHEHLGALEGLRAGGLVAYVATDQAGAVSLQLRRDLVLAVEQRVEHADVGAYLEQLARDESADVSGAPGNGNDHLEPPPRSGSSRPALTAWTTRSSRSSPRWG